MNAPTATKDNERCRLLLVAPPLANGDALAKLLSAALSGGDVASVILDGSDLDEATFQASAQKPLPLSRKKARLQSFSTIPVSLAVSARMAFTSKAR